MRVLRANATRSSTVPSFWRLAPALGARSSPRVVEHADDANVGIALCRERPDQRVAALVGAHHDGASVEPALPRPVSHQQEQRAAESQQGKKADPVERPEPNARVVIAHFREERRADRDQEDHRPRRGEPEILLLIPAKRLDLIDVGDLKGRHRRHGDPQNGAGVMPLEPFARNDVSDIDQEPDQHGQRKLDHANGAGDHDRRPRRCDRFRGDVDGQRRQAALFARRRGFWPARRGDRTHAEGGGRPHHLARVELEHVAPEPMEREPRHRLFRRCFR